MVTIVPGVWKLRFGSPEKLTPVSIREFDIAEEGFKNLPKPGNLPFPFSKITFKTYSRGCKLELPMDDKEQLYGFGLQLMSFNQNGRKKMLRVNSDPKVDTGDAHSPVPLYLSTNGYGIFVDTARYVTFYCGSHVKVPKKDVKAEARKGKVADNLADLYTPENVKDKTVAIDIPVAKGVDIYIFAGPTIKEAIQRYNLFSGGGCLVPFWGLGIWYRVFGNAYEKDVIRLAEYMRKNKIPCDVFGLEPGWQSHSYACSYTWDKIRFKNPDRMIKKLNNLGYEVNLWEHAFIHPTSPIYKKMKKYSGEIEVFKRGLVPDFLVPAARKIFADFHKRNLIQKGITSFKLDECDNSDYITGWPWSFPEYSEFPSGLDGEQMHQLFGRLFSRTHYGPFRELNLRTYSGCRSNHALGAPYPFVHYSDLYDHNVFIRVTVNMGFSGLIWCPEVRQCESSEDLIRRIQTVVFSPQVNINAWMIKNPPWLQYEYEKNNKNQFVKNHKQLEGICRKYFEIRMSLLPYLYSAFCKYHLEGLPPFRALVMDYPQDKNVYKLDSEYMMGESLLVAPVTAGKNKREIYLPAGDWYDFWTKKKYKGGKKYEINSPLDKIPVFVKSGTILPLAKPVQHVTKDTVFDIEVLVFGKNCKPFTLYEDNDYTYDFEKGKYNTTVFKPDGTYARSGKYPGKKYNFSSWKYFR